MNYPKTVSRIQFMYEWEEKDDIEEIADSILTYVDNVDSVMEPVDFNPYYHVVIDIDPESAPIDVIDNEIKAVIADSRKSRKRKKRK